jgi:hypothetical protein
MATVRSSSLSKLALVVLSLFLIVLLQYEYDATKAVVPANATSASASGVTPLMVRIADLGFHPAVASFLWATTMPEILDLWNKKTEYFSDFNFVTGVDPKLSYPYAFSVLTLPAVPPQDDPQAVVQAYTIGQQGIANGDSDWRIPYYMATNEFLYAKDDVAAAKYYDIAAHTPGIPAYAERFSLNFGIETNQRQKTEQLWETIKDSTNDPATQARAQAYIDHLQDFDYLDAAAALYKKEFGVFPTSTDELVAKGVISSVPVDPFGFTFILNKDGTSGIDLTKLPSYISAEPAQ